MGKYLFKRILFSIFSLIVVIFAVMALIYKAIDPEVIFQEDKSKAQYNALTHYKQAKLERYGYVDFIDYSDFVKEKIEAKYGTGCLEEENYKNPETGVIDYTALKVINDEYKKYTNIINYYETTDIEKTVKGTDTKVTITVASYVPQTPQEIIEKNPDANEYLIEFNDYYSKKGYTVTLLPYVILADASGNKVIKNIPKGGTPYLYATKNNSIFDRVWKYLKDFITVETTKDVKDTNLTDRYIRLEWDKISNMPALVGSGTTHKYLIYFDNQFPYIHQNIVRIKLGKSAVISVDTQVTEYMNFKTGNLVNTTKQSPVQIASGSSETMNTAYDFHTVTYSSFISDFDRTLYTDNYTNALNEIDGLSRIGNSFVTGLIATIIAYLLGLPLGILMARKKDKLADKLGMAYIIFIMAVPSLVYIFIFAAIGTTIFGLPYKVANAEVRWLGYILPTISLALPSVGGLMKWMRRYMIDQMNSDYVKFARSQGLSEGEIFTKHISKNAMIYLVHGIPASILGCLTGAIITESVYGLEGIGKLLTSSITLHDNAVIVACTVFFTSLSIVALILGDLLLATYDPRISLTEGGGR